MRMFRPRSDRRCSSAAAGGKEFFLSIVLAGQGRCAGEERQTAKAYV